MPARFGRGRKGRSSGQVAVPPAGKYVATTGDNNNPGTFEQPWRLLSYAVQQVASPDTIYLRAGTYDELIEWFGWPGGTQGTSWGTAITISGYAGETVTVRPPAASPYLMVMRGSGSGATDAPRYIIFNNIIFDGSAVTGNEGVYITAWDNPTGNAPSHHIRFTNCRITGLPHAQGILCTWGSDDVQLFDCEIDNIGGPTTIPNNTQAIYGAGHNMVVENCHIHDCWGYGISNINSIGSNDVNNHVIRGNRVHDCGQGGTGLGGINLGEGTGHLIANNRSYNNAGPGLIIAFGDGATGLKIYNNTVYNNSDYGIRVGGGHTGTLVRNNISYLNAVNYSDAGSGTVANNNLIGVDPGFVNAAAANFHLASSTSAAANTGTTLTDVPTDADGVSRPQGAAYDIGAFEDW